jgi:hypothetical protein
MEGIMLDSIEQLQKENDYLRLQIANLKMLLEQAMQKLESIHTYQSLQNPTN